MIRARIREFYSKEYPEISRTKRETVEAAAEALGSLYHLNVFPAMNLRWGTYPSHVGHQESPGCFRCHDEELKTAESEAISQDCSICQAVLAAEEESPEILGRLQPQRQPCPRAPHGYHSHMKRSTGTVAEVKNNLSRYLAYVRRGGRVTIYNRDTPVAELVPPPASVGGASGEVLARLEREGVIRRGRGRLVPEVLKPPRGRSAGVLEALLADREAGR